MDSKSVREIVIDVLREMYAEAEPPLDFDEVVDNPDSFGSNWYKQHFLPQERQKEILDKHLAQHELTSGERTTVLMECGLHLAPTTKRNVEE